MLKFIYCFLYYAFAQHLPISYKPYAFGAKKIRYWVCSHMFSKCGKNVNVEKGASFGSGRQIQIGNNSGIGVRCSVGAVIIGNNVMMGPEAVILSGSHNYDKIDVPMSEQGRITASPVIIGDDVWIGTRVIILPGCKVGKGVIIGAGAVVAKDVPDYAVVAGNPARIIRYRKAESNN
jgi:maltose O-acetyltransferase